MPLHLAVLLERTGEAGKRFIENTIVPEAVVGTAPMQRSSPQLRTMPKPGQWGTMDVMLAAVTIPY